MSKNKNRQRYDIMSAINKSKITKGKGFTSFVILAALAFLFLFLNDSFFHIEGLPALKQLFGEKESFNNTAGIDSDALNVHFIDVGQGDCQLIISNGKAALIDCGEREYKDKVINYIKALGIRKLDYVTASHPHSDHMGGMSYIIDEFEIGSVIMPKIPDLQLPTTNAFSRLIKSIDKKKIKIIYPKAGEKFSVGKADMTVLSPVGEYDNLNNYSVALKLVQGKNSFLFTGDTEKPAEADILKTKADISAAVLKLAHHGSSTSSHKAFIDAVSPQYAIIEVGKGNDYGHPHKETLKRISELNAKVYRTDLNGSIVFSCSDEGISVRCEKK